jgi:hypothetical protein
MAARAFAYGGDYPARAYLQQLDRAHRFLQRYRSVVFYRPGGEQADWYTIDDLLWAFFQNCWHVKDWLGHDPTVPPAQRRAAAEAAEADPDLQIIADLANGAKHFLVRGERTGARDAAMQLVDGPDGSTGFMPVIELADRTSSLALTVALRGMEAWRTILSAAALDYFVGPD